MPLTTVWNFYSCFIAVIFFFQTFTNLTRQETVTVPRLGNRESTSVTIDRHNTGRENVNHVTPPRYSPCVLAPSNTSRNLTSTFTDRSTERETVSVTSGAVSNPVTEEVQTNTTLHEDTSNQFSDTQDRNVQNSNCSTNDDKTAPLSKRDSWVENEEDKQNSIKDNIERLKKKRSKPKTKTKGESSKLTELPPLRGMGERNSSQNKALLPPIHEASRAKTYDIFTVSN